MENPQLGPIRKRGVDQRELPAVRMANCGCPATIHDEGESGADARSRPEDSQERAARDRLPVEGRNPTEEVKSSAGMLSQDAGTPSDVFVLVVDDEPAVRNLVTRLLQRLGYSVVHAESGRVALSVWAEHKERIGLLLTDICMPGGMSGRELALLLQQEKPDLRVIYTSGYAAPFLDGGPPLTRGINFLPKPYSLPILAQTIRACLGRD